MSFECGGYYLSQNILDLYLTLVKMLHLQEVNVVFSVWEIR